MIVFVLFTFILLILEIYYYCIYLRRRKYIKNYKHLQKEYNNSTISSYYLDTLFNSQIYFNTIGKLCNKSTLELSYLEFSQIIHTVIFSNQRKIKLDEIFKYKKYIYDLQNKYCTNDNLFDSNNKNVKYIPGLGSFNVNYKPFILKLLLIIIRIFFDIYMEYYLGYFIYYDNLTHYKFYFKINNENKPIYMFIHGLGRGIIQNYKLINLFTDKNMIYIDVPNTSLRKEFDYLDDRILYIAFENFIRQHGITKNNKKINLMGHSYGGIISQKLLNQYEELIDKVYFIESPVFPSGMSHLMYCICFSQKILKPEYKYIINTDLNVEQQLFKTDTSQKILFNKKHCDNNKYVCCFAESDEIVDFNTIQLCELSYENVKYISYPGTHGEIIINKNTILKIKNLLD